MNIVVCIKQVPDPEMPGSRLKIGETSRTVEVPADAETVISPFDENALEAALEIKGALGAHVVVLSLGDDSCRKALRRALAMGADEAVLLSDPAFAGGDSHSTAYVLSQAIRRLSSYDLVLCGRQAADWDAGQVPLGIAESLGVAALTPIGHLEVTDGAVRVRRMTDYGYDACVVTPPAVLAMSNEANSPRYPSLRGIIEVDRKPFVRWTASDIEADVTRAGAAGAKTAIAALRIPATERECEFLEGDSFEGVAARLLQRLREERLL